MIRRRLAPVAALALLWALWLPAADPDTHQLFVALRPASVLALVIAGLAGLALARRPLPRLPRALVAALLVAAAGLNLVAALVLRFLDRPLDLYFDPPQVPSLFGLFTGAVGGGRAALVFAAGLAATGALLLAVDWALGSLGRALAPRRRALGALALAVVALGAGLLPGPLSPVGTGAARTLADQARRVAVAWAVLHGYDDRYAATLAKPEPPQTDLAGLARQDVLLIFFESYGTIVLDDPAYRAVVAPALADFAAVVEKSGYTLASSRLVSPTFGGGSWLAHGTLASGIKLDPFLDRLVMASPRKSLPRYLAATGYRTVDVMPGIRKPWPDGRFWGFEQNYYARDLGYDGPPFGWFNIPDQYTLETFAERELGPGHPPLFAQIVLVSSHTPFAPVPPYVADWRQTERFLGVSKAEWQEIYREPDWSHLDGAYLASVVYDLRTLAAWLARIDGNPLVIILGDHQPPGFVSGTKAPWTVPIHVLSRDRNFVAPFLRAGYVRGALPPATGAAKGMESFLGEFLGAFSEGAAE